MRYLRRLVLLLTLKIFSLEITVVVHTFNPNTQDVTGVPQKEDQPRLVVYIYNPSTWEVEAGE